MSGGKFVFNIGFKTDKSSLNEVLSILQQIEQQANKAGQGQALNSNLQNTANIASNLKKILESSWDNKLNQLDLNKLNNSINKSYGSLGNLKSQLNNIGADRAFNILTKDVLNTNIQLKKSKTLLDELAQTMTNTVKWGITSSIFNTMTDSIQNAWNYAKALDSSLNDIRIVTGKSSDEMANFAIQANKVAKSLGAATKDYTNASLIYYQQGLSEQDVQARAQTTLKAANVTGQSGQEVSEQLTAVWNGYKVSAQEAELYIDKLAAVAADTAADLEELSTGMSKVASAANLMGVDIDQLNAQLATIVSVTRQAPESVGTALKTIYARMGDIKAGLDGEVTLDEYTSQMAEMGVNVLDANGNLRDMGTVIEEIGEKWTSMSREQQISLSQIMAGTRQYNNLLSLFDNWDMYTKALNTSANAAGTLQKQQETYMESISAHLQKLTTETEKTYDIIFDEKQINIFLDALTNVVSVFNNLLSITSKGNLFGGLGSLGLMGANLFSSQIAQGINQSVQNRERSTTNKNKDITKDNFYQYATQQYTSEGITFTDVGLQAIKDSYSTIKGYTQYLNDNQQQEFIERQKNIGLIAEQIAKYEEIVNKVKQINSLEQERSKYTVAGINELEQTVQQKQKAINDAQKEIEKNNLKIQNASLNKTQKTEIKNKVENEIKDFLDKYDKNIENANSKSKGGMQAYRNRIASEDYKKEQIATEEAYALQQITEKYTKEIEKQENIIKNNKINLEQQKEDLAQAKIYISDLKDIEANRTQELQEQKQALIGQQLSAAELAKRTEQIQTGIQLITGSLNIIQTSIGIIRTLFDEDIAIEDKVTQIGTGLINITLTLMQLVPVIQSLKAGGGIVNFFKVTLPGALGISKAGFLGLNAAAAPWLAIAAAIIAVSYGIYKAVTAEAEATKKLEEKVTNLTSAYNQAKESADNFKKSISDYKEIRDELDNLTEGTQEYIDKVKEANELSLQLLAENPDLANQVTRDKHGILTFSEEALNEIAQRKNQAATSVGLEKIQAQIDLSNNTIKNTLKEVDSLKVKNYRTIEDINNEVLSNNQGNIDLKNRPKFKQDDGSLSTVNSIIISNEKGEYIVIPTIRRDEYNKAIQMSDEEAEDYFNSTGEFLGKFDKLSEAEYYARDLHNSQDYLYNNNYVKTVKKLSDEEMKDIYDSIADYAVEHNLKTITEEELVQITELKNLETDIIKTLASEDNIIALKGALGTLIQQKALQKQYYIEANRIWLDNNTELNKYNNLEKTYLATKIGKQDVDIINDFEEASRHSKRQFEIKDKLDDDAYKKEAYNLYAESKGYKTLTSEDPMKDYFAWVNGSYYFKDKETGKNIENLNESQLASFIAEFEIKNEKITAVYQEYSKILDSFKENTKSIEGIDVYSKVLEGAVAEGNKISLQDQMAQLSPTEAKTYAEMDTETFKQYFGITDEVIEQAGYDVIEELQDAFKNYKWNTEDAVAQSLQGKDEELKKLGIEKEEIEDYSIHIMDAAHLSKEFADGLEEDANAATIVAQSIMRMNNGIDTLADNFKEWNDILQKSDRMSQEYSQALSGIEKALIEVYDLSEDYISSSFIEEHLDEIAKVAKGDADAIESLRKELSQDIVAKISLQNELDNQDKTKFEKLVSDLQADIPELDIGYRITQDDASYRSYLTRMQEIIDAAGLTAEQANALFSTMGFQATYAEENQNVSYMVPEYETEMVMDTSESGFPKLKFKTTQTDMKKYTGSYPVSAMAVTPQGEAPKTPVIKSLVKKGTGAQNNYSSSNRGGGGPGKSGGSDKKPDKKDPIEEKKDVYHDINIILKQISTELDRLEKQEEKLVGQDLIDNLNEQWGRLQDTIDATNEKIRIARGEMSRLQGELGAKGVTFNPDGTIANYAAAYDQQLAAVNAVINHYNSLSAEGQEAYKDTVEQAEKNWEEFLDNISEYDELVSETIPELEDDIQAAIDEQIEIQIEKFNMEIELRLDMAEAERDWNEFKKRIIDDIEDDDILGNAQAKLLDYNSYYKPDGTGVIQKNTQHVNEIIEQLKSIEATGTSSIYGDNEAQALEDLKTYYEQLMSDLTDVHDLIDEIRESYLDMMDEAQDKFDEQVETYEYIRDLLTHDMDLITMVYGDEAYDKLVDFYEKQEDNYNKQLDFQRQQKDFWKAQMDSLEEGSDEWQKAKENWMSAVEEWNSLVEEAIENLQDKYLNAINNIFANLNNKVTDGLGLDYVEQEWDLINKNADQYLDTINAVFETQQLENKYLDAIDNTDNISAQRKLNDLMKEEIKALEQKDKLTQYDIDRANLKYEIALKQIALEEAQQTKSSMRLRRDSQGNYRYEFVADNDAIAEAEDELSVLQNQLYNMDVEQYRSNLDQLYEIYVEWQEALAEAAQINDPEARAERELMINEQYGELINGIVEENEVIKTNLRESAFDELVNLHQMELEEVEALSQAEKDIMLEDMIPQWTSGVQTMADVFAGEGGFIPTCKDALNDLNNATQDYEDSLVELQYQGGFTFNDIVAGENEAIYTAMGLLQVNNELINSYKAEFDALNAVLGQLDGLIGKYGSAQNAANAAAEAAYKYADALLAQFAAAQGSYTGKGRFYGSGGSSSGGSVGNLTSISGVNNSGGNGLNSTKSSSNNNSSNNKTSSNNTNNSSVSNSHNILQDIPDFNDRVNGSKYDPSLINKLIKRYDTGGYTGAWGSNGKLAILDQKELVLNQRDTENILDAIEIMRHVTNSIDNSIFSRVADFTSGLGIAAPELTSEALEQNVHIEANFPNVQSSREIEEAINNLTNIASQRANKSTRY